MEFVINIIDSCGCAFGDTGLTTKQGIDLCIDFKGTDDINGQQEGKCRNQLRKSNLAKNLPVIWRQTFCDSYNVSLSMLRIPAKRIIILKAKLLQSQK